MAFDGEVLAIQKRELEQREKTPKVDLIFERSATPEKKVERLQSLSSLRFSNDLTGALESLFVSETDGEVSIDFRMPVNSHSPEEPSLLGTVVTRVVEGEVPEMTHQEARANLLFELAVTRATTLLFQSEALAKTLQGGDPLKTYVHRDGKTFSLPINL